MRLTLKEMKFVLLAIITTIALSACNHKKAAYTCTCNSRATEMFDSSFDLGQNISKDDAYSQCKIHNNTVDTCYMLIMN